MAPRDKKTPKPSKLEKKLAAATSTVDELSAQVKVLRARVKELEVEADTWRKRAEKQRSRVKKITAQAEKAIAEAAAAAKKRAKAKAKQKVRQAIADHPRAEPLALKDAPALPQPTWTVAQLRAAAREQGVAGYSRMRKEQLIRSLV